MYIAQVSVTAYRFRLRPRCVQYAVTVRGLTPYLHPMCLYDLDSCLSRDVAVFTHWKRFSTVIQLHKALQAELPNTQLPALPSHWLPVHSPSGLQVRQQQLSVYFSSLLEIPQAKHSIALCSFFQPSMHLNLRVAGVPGIGKMRLLEAFFSVRHRKERDELPGLRNRQLRDSGVYPDRADLPVDLVVDQTLVRITMIEVVTLSEDSDLKFSNTDGIIFAFSEEVPTSLSPIRRKRMETDIDSAVVALDEGPNFGQGQFSATSLSDVYTVFEYLVRRHLRRKQK